MPYSVSPSHFELDFDSSETQVFTVSVKNSGSRWGMFKMKTNGKQAYSARPRAGLIAGGETVSVCVKYKKGRISGEVDTSLKATTDVLAIMVRDLVAEETYITSLKAGSEGESLLSRVGEFSSVHSLQSPKSVSAFVSTAWDVHSGHDSAAILKISIHPYGGSGGSVLRPSPSPSPQRNTSPSAIVHSYPTADQQPWSERTISVKDLSQALCASTEIDEVLRVETSSDKVLITYKDSSLARDALKTAKAGQMFNPVVDLGGVPQLPVLKVHLKCGQLCSYLDTGRKLDDVENVEVSQGDSPWKIILERHSCFIVFSEGRCCNHADLCSLKPVVTLESKKLVLTAHGGLWNTAHLQLSAIIDSLKQFRPESYKTITVTGHGKQGAYAQAIAILLGSTNHFKSSTITSVTFGAVRLLMSSKPSGSVRHMFGLERVKHYCYRHVDDPVASLFTLRHDDVIKNSTNTNHLVRCLQVSSSDVRTYSAVAASVHAIPDWVGLEASIDTTHPANIIALSKPHLTRSSFSVSAHSISSYLCFINELVQSRHSKVPHHPAIIKATPTKTKTTSIIANKHFQAFAKAAAICCAVSLFAWIAYSYIELDSIWSILYSAWSWVWFSLTWCYDTIAFALSGFSLEDIDEFFTSLDEYLQETITWTSLATVIYRCCQFAIDAAVWIINFVLGVLF